MLLLLLSGCWCKGRLGEGRLEDIYGGTVRGGGNSLGIKGGVGWKKETLWCEKYKNINQKEYKKYDTVDSYYAFFLKPKFGQTKSQHFYRLGKLRQKNLNHPINQNFIIVIK